MANMGEAAVRALFEKANHAVISTVDEDGGIHSTVVWVDLEGGQPAVNSAVGRRWPSNLERDPRATLVVYDESNPYEYVEVRGRVRATTEGADAHIDRLARKYLGLDRYPYHQAGEQRITFVLEPSVVRHQKQ